MFPPGSYDHSLIWAWEGLSAVLHATQIYPVGLGFESTTTTALKVVLNTSRTENDIMCFRKQFKATQSDQNKKEVYVFR